MINRVLVFKVGGAYEPSVLAAFSIADLKQAVAFWEGNNDEYYPPIVEVWEGDRMIGRAHDVSQLMDGEVVSDDMSIVPLVPNRRKRSSRRKR